MKYDSCVIPDKCMIYMRIIDDDFLSELVKMCFRESKLKYYIWILIIVFCIIYIFLHFYQYNFSPLIRVNKMNKTIFNRRKNIVNKNVHSKPIIQTGKPKKGRQVFISYIHTLDKKIYIRQNLRVMNY